METSDSIEYRTSEAIAADALTALLDESWPDHARLDPEVLRRYSAG